MWEKDSWWTVSSIPVTKKMDNMVLPAGYSYEMGGEVESRKDSFGGFTSVIIVTVFLVHRRPGTVVWYI